jgi:signal peptidase I
MTENKKKTIKEVLSWVLVIAAAYVLAFLITHFVIIKTEVISGSMESTLNIDDRVIGNRLAYTFSDPERGDIIFFANPLNETETYVKRIIGCPGETVEIRDGKVYINEAAVPLDEPYLKEKMKGSFGPYVVPENSFFVMGDNRNRSEDSRVWGFVARDEIYAKAWFRYKPSIDAVEAATYE